MLSDMAHWYSAHRATTAKCSLRCTISSINSASKAIKTAAWPSSKTALGHRRQEKPCVQNWKHSKNSTSSSRFSPLKARSNPPTSQHSKHWQKRFWPDRSDEHSSPRALIKTALPFCSLPLCETALLPRNTVVVAERQRCFFKRHSKNS